MGCSALPVAALHKFKAAEAVRWLEYSGFPSTLSQPGQMPDGENIATWQKTQKTSGWATNRDSLIV